MNQLSADNLHLWRGEQHVLRGVSFVITAGECLQVTGNNGAGKTTLLRALCGLVPLEAGQVQWCGIDVAHDASAFHAELSYLGHDNGLKADLTAAENLRYAVAMRWRLAAAAIHAALLRTGVDEVSAQPLRRLSAGQRRRVALARLVLSASGVWVLDEPGSNLDADGQSMLQGLLTEHLADNGTAVVATHQALGLEPARLRSLALQ